MLALVPFCGEGGGGERMRVGSSVFFFFFSPRHFLFSLATRRRRHSTPLSETGQTHRLPVAAHNEFTAHDASSEKYFRKREEKA